MSREENFWNRFFAVATQAQRPETSLWPEVLARIEAETMRRESFSAAVLWMGRRLAPVSSSCVSSWAARHYGEATIICWFRTPLW